MTQRVVYTKIFETVLPTVLDKLTSKEDYPLPASKDHVEAHVKGMLEEAISYASNIAWKASFTWAETMTVFMHMDDDEGIAGTANESVAKVQNMSLTEYEMGFEDPENN